MRKILRNEINQTEIKEVLKEFPLDILATKEVAFSFKKGRLFKVNPLKIKNPAHRHLKYPKDIYIIHSPQILEIACFPHLVGKELEKRTTIAGEQVAKAIQKLWLSKNKETLIYDVLRAGPSYKVYEGLKKLKIDLKRIKIRTRYKLPSYRHHNGSCGQLEIIYEDFSNLPSNKELVIIKPDTEAAAGTSHLAIKRLIEVAKEKNSKIKTIICTGFISCASLNVLEKLAIKNNFELKVLAWGNLTALYKNGYDMPLYGIDEAYYKETGKIRKLGAVIPKEILGDYLKYFVCGIDQVGDWSARQTMLYNGYGFEKGDILNHLNHSLNFIKSLYEISKNQKWFKKWQKEIFEKEIKELATALTLYDRK